MPRPFLPAVVTRQRPPTEEMIRMQYLVSVIDDQLDPGPPSDMAAIGAFNDRLKAQGYWVYANGMAPPSTATVIDGRGEEPVFTDGPFVETKEYLAGFWIIAAPNLDVALKLAAEGSKVCNRRVEVRPFHQGTSA